MASNDINLGVGADAERKKFQFSVSNNTPHVQELLDVKTSCSCVERLAVSPRVVVPGGKALVTGTYVFPPAGERQSSVYVFAAGIEDPVVTVKVGGVSVPDFTLDRMRLLFGNVERGSEVVKSVVFRAFRRPDGHRVSVTALEPSVPWLHARLEPAKELNMTTPVSFEAFRITVKVLPGALGGDFSETVTVRTDATNKLAQKVELSVSGSVID